MILFQTLSDVEDWASQHGGLEAVNESLASGAFGQNAQTIRTAIRYVEREELRIADRLIREDKRQQSVSAAEQSARAAQRSAREASLSRWVAIASAGIALVAALIATGRWFW